MDQVNTTREAVVLTKNGRPVAKRVLANSEPKDVFGCLRGVMEIVGDIESAAIFLEDWESLK